ncbi:MAG: CPBP family intramembrane metalloprotease [Clostridiales bacterium]|nr:CPBP family intramembrane metalloprotease [Clostridiales bacterium]
MKIEHGEEDGGLSGQQKFWLGGKAILSAMKPLALYMILPSLLMCIPLMLPGKREASDVIGRSGNFYSTLGICLTVYLLWRASRKRGSSLWADATLELRGLEKKRLAELVLMGLCFALALSAVLSLLPSVGLSAEYGASSSVLGAGTDRILVILSVLILAPVAEEIIFRGYMLNRLLGYFSKRDSLLISTVAFALCHVSPIWVVYSFCMGYLLGWVSMKEDNTVYAIALHAGFNISLFPVWVFNRLGLADAVGWGRICFLLFLAVLASVGGCLLFQRYKKGEWMND